jgi:hypothetical protein
MTLEHAQISIDKAHREGPTDEYDLAVRAIVADLNDRRGLKTEWRQIDPDIREEIIHTWRLILLSVFPPEDD